MVEAVTPIEPYTEQVYQALVQAIVRGEMPPGQPIPQSKIAAAFGVSRQPVSHALHLLRQQGLIETWGRKGFAVAEIRADHVRHLFQIRGSLDTLAARLAAERVAGGELVAVDVAGAFAALEAKTGVDGAPLANIDRELAFHGLIYELSGNPWIASTLAGHWPHLLRAIAVIHGRVGSGFASSEHAALASAIVSGDGARAELLALGHSQRASAEIAQHLAERERANQATATQRAGKPQGPRPQLIGAGNK